MEQVPHLMELQVAIFVGVKHIEGFLVHHILSLRPSS